MLFSILTPSYRAARFIGDAIASVAQQNRADVEHVVVDGKSEDGTLEILQAARHPLRFLYEPDSGQSNALNKALALATGEWIGWLNADEFYLPGALDRVAQVIDGNPEADVIFADCCFVDADGAFMRLVPEHDMSRSVLRWYGCAIHTCATFMRRDVLVAQGFDDDCHDVMDWELFLGLHTRGARFHYLPEMLTAFRVHAEQITATSAGLRGAEAARVRDRYRIPSARWASKVLRVVGRVEHIARKVRGGAFLREYRERRTRVGQNMRWFPPV